MGNCCTCCVPKCFPCCGKKRCEGHEAQPSETAPSVLNCTRTPVGDANGAQTFQELVDCLTQQSEKKRKTNKSKRNQGSLACWLERMMCCRLFGKPPSDSAFWIDTPQGYLERRYEDI